MRRLSPFLTTLGPLTLASCVAPSRPAQVTSVAAVVDRVKDELAACAKAPPPQGETDNACRNRLIGLEPDGVALKLQAAVERKNDPSLGLSVSFGVITLDKPFAAAFATRSTQTIDIPLDPNDIRGEPSTARHPLADAMVALRDELNRVHAGQGQCFRIGKIKFTLDLDVVRSVSTGIDLELAGVELSDKASWTSRTSQTLTITFEEAGYTIR